jgi:hypothetical protein
MKELLERFTKMECIQGEALYETWRKALLENNGAEPGTWDFDLYFPEKAAWILLAKSISATA